MFRWLPGSTSEVPCAYDFKLSSSLGAHIMLVNKGLRFPDALSVSEERL